MMLSSVGTIGGDIQRSEIDRQTRLLSYVGFNNAYHMYAPHTTYYERIIIGLDIMKKAKKKVPGT